MMVNNRTVEDGEPARHAVPYVAKTCGYAQVDRCHEGMQFIILL